jgi:hypothetical protein
MRGELESDLEISQSTLEWIRHRLGKSAVMNPILGIVWGKWTTEESQRWSIGIYNRNTFEGWLVRCPTLEFVIVQDFLLDRLKGMTLEIDDSGVHIRQKLSK